MLVIEGCDNVGKSTLIRELLDLDPRLRLIKRRRFRPEREETIGTSYLECLMSRDRVAHGYGVVDRLLASECIYGDLFREGCRMTEAEHFAIRNLLLSYQAIVVHCDAPDDRILENWSAREQLYDDPLIIAHAYRQRLSSIFEPNTIVRYDWTSPDAARTRRRIVEFHEARQEALRPELAWWTRYPFGVGSLTPDLIFVGESLNAQARSPVPFANGPAGNFLAWAIDQLDPIIKQGVYVTNARKGRRDDRRILRDELTYLIKERSTRVVLLGRSAEEMYERADLDVEPRSVGSAPHPMFWRRFHWRDRERYVLLLKQAMEGDRS